MTILNNEQAFEKWKAEELPKLLEDAVKPELLAQLSKVMIPTAPILSEAEVFSRLSKTSEIGLFGSRAGINKAPSLPVPSMIENKRQGPAGSRGAGS